MVTLVQKDDFVEKNRFFPLRDVIPQSVDFSGGSEIKTFDGSSGFWMLDTRWKGLERLIRMSQVSAQGDAVFLAFLRRENPTKPYLGSKINRVAGRVIKNACGSVTIDVLMM